MMGEGGDGVEAEHRAGALDRVQRAERGVDQVGVARRVLEVEQRLLELFQQFRRLLAVDLGGIGAAHAPSTLRDHRQQLVLLERLGDPAGGAGGLRFLLHVRLPIQW